MTSGDKIKPGDTTTGLPDNLTRMTLSWNDRRCLTLTDGATVSRFIRAESAQEMRSLYRCGLIEQLVAKGLLQPGSLRETGITAYPLVVEHPFIERISYPFEWPTLALKEAALAVLEIEEEANRYGYTLYDPHPFNMVIGDGRLLYLDHGSFVPVSGTPIWHGYEKAFRDSFLFPLQLFEKKLHYLGRLILREIVSNDLDTSTRALAGNRFQRSLLDRLVIAVTSRGEITSERLTSRIVIAVLDRALRIKWLKGLLEGLSFRARPPDKSGAATSTGDEAPESGAKVLGSRAAFIRRLRRKVESVAVSSGSSHWSAYYENIIGTKPPWQRDTGSWTTKELSVHEIITRLSPASVLDIGANTGWFSLMAAHSGSSVISFDRDEESINQLYSYVRREGTKVLPLIMDIRQPTPSYDLNIGTIPQAASRFKCELVMVLGIIHHMVHNQGVSIEHLADMLAAFTGKYLLVELVPPDDEWAKLPDFTQENWNADVLQQGFSRHFDYEGSWDSYPQGRQLLLFRTKVNHGS